VWPDTIGAGCGACLLSWCSSRCRRRPEERQAAARRYDLSRPPRNSSQCTSPSGNDALETQEAESLAYTAENRPVGLVETRGFEPRASLTCARRKSLPAKDVRRSSIDGLKELAPILALPLPGKRVAPSPAASRPWPERSRSLSSRWQGSAKPLRTGARHCATSTEAACFIGLPTASSCSTDGRVASLASVPARPTSSSQRTGTGQSPLSH